MHHYPKTRGADPLARLGTGIAYQRDRAQDGIEREHCVHENDLGHHRLGGRGVPIDLCLKILHHGHVENLLHCRVQDEHPAHQHDNAVQVERPLNDALQRNRKPFRLKRADHLDQQLEKLKGQDDRGIQLPKPELPLVLDLLDQ